MQHYSPHFFAIMVMKNQREKRIVAAVVFVGMYVFLGGATSLLGLMLFLLFPFIFELVVIKLWKRERNPCLSVLIALSPASTLNKLSLIVLMDAPRRGLTFFVR